ncbi:hypothetical protein SLS54_008967 [Diplodia seriata]
MPILKSLVLGALALSQFTHAYPAPEQSLEARKLYSMDAASGLEKRTLFNVDAISNEDQKKALKTAQKEAVEVAALVLDKMDDKKYEDYLPAWFGDDKGHRDKVRNVFKNFVGSNDNDEGAEVLGNVIVHDDDYNKADDGTPFCSVVKDGKTGTAYYMKRDDKPGMHYCPKFFTRKSKDDYIKDKCASISQHINTDTIGRAFQAANVLHEFMHYPEVGKKATGHLVRDPAYGAYSSYVLKNTDKSKTILNSDSYVYYAMHIWLTETCGRDFSYPRNESDN